MTKTFLSSAPVGRSLHAMRCSMMNSPLHRMARVTAICTTMMMAPTLLRRMAESMGTSSMAFPLLSFQLPSGLDMRGAPRGVQTCQGRGDDGCHHRDTDLSETQMSETRGLFRQYRTQTQEAGRRQPKSHESACKSDHPRLDQTLTEYGAAIGAERATHADVAGPSHDLGQHQAHGIQQADQEKTE